MTSSSIVKETANLLRATAPSFVSIRTRIASDSMFIFADPSQVQQVVMNLCTNAVHAMREKGGVLDIGLSSITIPPSDENIHRMKPGPYVVLTISDTGIGISPDIIDRIYDPFFTTKDIGEGTGLGLSVVHGIVKQSDGHIFVESQPGKGTAFTVYFPEISGEATAEAPEDTVIPPWLRAHPLRRTSAHRAQPG